MRLFKGFRIEWMREVYFDESVADLFGKPLLFLAAYLAPEENWVAFNAEWDARILKAFSIPYLHAVELRSSQASAYKHLDVSARRALLSAACGLIVSHVDAGFGAYLRPADLAAVTSPNERARWGGAYGICTEMLLKLISDNVNHPERVNIFLEAGHANAASALRKIQNFKEDTEPVEWPELADTDNDDKDESLERQMRESAMRIGNYGTVTKKDCFPVQAADLFAYLAATPFRNDKHPVFSGCLDMLVKDKVHTLSPWGPASLKELVKGVRLTETRYKKDRENLYFRRKLYHAHGIRTHVLPWGLVLDKGPQDEISAELQKQIEAIKKKILD
jgi:hypothetical protein